MRQFSTSKSVLNGLTSSIDIFLAALESRRLKEASPLEFKLPRQSKNLEKVSFCKIKAFYACSQEKGVANTALCEPRSHIFRDVKAEKVLVQIKLRLFGRV